MCNSSYRSFEQETPAKEGGPGGIKGGRFMTESTGYVSRGTLWKKREKRNRSNKEEEQKGASAGIIAGAGRDSKTRRRWSLQRLKVGEKAVGKKPRIEDKRNLRGGL